MCFFSTPSSFESLEFTDFLTIYSANQGPHKSRKLWLPLFAWLLTFIFIAWITISRCRTIPFQRSTATFAERLTVPIDSLIFGFVEPTLTIESICISNIACDVILIHEATMIRMLNFFRKNITPAVLHTKLSSEHKSQTRKPSIQKKAPLSSYSQDVNFLPRTYETDENIPDTEEKITVLSQPPNRAASHCVEVASSKALKCEDV